MGFFGKAQKTTTEVKPDPRVEAMLKNIVTETQNMPEQQYINKMMAQLTPDQRSALTNVSNSSGLLAGANALSGALTQGLQQMTDANAQLQGVVRNPITPDQVLADKQLLQKGLQSTVTAQGAASVDSLGKGSAASRRAAKMGSTAINANRAIAPNLGNLAINQANQNQQNALDVSGMQSGIANKNVSLGLTGTDLMDQATQNKLNVGNLNQSLANQQNQIDYQNANGAALFPWEGVQNKLNIANQISSMAGSKTVTNGAAVPVGQQLAGAAIGGLGIAARLGAFDPTSTTNNAWDSYKNNGGQAGVQGAMPQGSAYDNLSQGTQQKRGIMSTLGGWFG